jgi:hypothetical protein
VTVILSAFHGLDASGDWALTILDGGLGGRLCSAARAQVPIPGLSPHRNRAISRVVDNLASGR